MEKGIEKGKEHVGEERPEDNKREEMSSIVISDKEQLIPADSPRKINNNLSMKERVIIIAKDYLIIGICTLIATIVFLLLGLFVWRDKFGWEAWITIVVVCIFNIKFYVLICNTPLYT
jgi:hypothetical protein